MATRYWIHETSGTEDEQIGGPFDSEGAAAETARLLNEQVDDGREYEYHSPHDDMPESDGDVPRGLKQQALSNRLAGNSGW
jgi:hypothetical protein